MLGRLLKKAAFFTAVAWKRSEVDTTKSLLLQFVPRFNLPGESPGGEKCRVDCRSCGIPTVWEAMGFVCPECGKCLPPQVAAACFEEAALELLRIAEALEDIEVKPRDRGLLVPDEFLTGDVDNGQR